MRGWLLRTRRRYRITSLTPDRTRRFHQVGWRVAFRLVILLAVMLGLFSHVQPAHAAACDVTLNTDGNPGGGGDPGELRWAIGQANASSCSGQITFHIGATGSTQTITIAAGQPFPSITQPVMIDGSTQDTAGTICNATTGPHPEIVIDASAISFTDSALWLDNGSDGSEIKGLVIVNGPRNAILGYSSNNTVDCNYIGVAADGTTAAGNNDGIYFTKNLANPSPSNNVIGGTTPDARNVIAANLSFAVEFDSAGSTGNIIEGNYTGTDATGTIALDGALVVLEGGASGNTIGGTTPGAGNLLSGASTGTGIFLGSTGTSNNVIEGNYIGTDATGMAALANDGGIQLAIGASNNTIGGTTAAARNIISGNTTFGIRLQDPGTSNNVIEGNYIGTDINGTSALGNQTGVQSFNSASGNTIGGTTAGARNIISGNGFFGISIDAGSSNVITGNYIGTDNTGTSAIPNGVGITIENAAPNNTVGGTTAAVRNIISGNSVVGINIQNIGSTGNIVEGNYIGTDVTGTLALANSTGMQLGQGAASNTIGGTTAGAGNLISGNTNTALAFADTGTSNNLVEGNYFGLDDTGTVALPNLRDVLFYNSASGNTVGGTAAADRNIIASSSGDYGVRIQDAGTNNNVVQGNFIGTDVTGAVAMPNSSGGVQIWNGAQNNIIGGIGAGEANLITMNTGTGVVVQDAASTGNTIRGNVDYNNSGIGIDLSNDGVTANDTNDPDSGPNNLQNYPILNSLSAVGPTYTVTGGLNSVPNSGPYQIDFYSSATCNGSGNGDGKSYLGSTTVSTNASGNANFGPIGLSGFLGETVITMTATNPSGSTSEFSSCTIGPPLVDAPPPPSLAVTFGSVASSVPPDALTIDFGSDSDLVVSDDPFTLSATITNTSSSTVNDVVVRIQAADDFDVVDTSANVGDTQIECQLGSATLPSLAPGHQMHVVVTLKVDPSYASNGETDNVIAAEYAGGRLKTAGKKVAVEGIGSTLPSTGYPPPADPPVPPAVALLLIAAGLTGTAFISTRIRKRATGSRS